MSDLLKYSVGIDVSKAELDLNFSSIDNSQTVKVKATRKVKNSPSGHRELIQWAEKHRKEDIPLFFIMEATGVYYENIAALLYSEGHNVSVTLPNKAKKYIQSIGYKSKNDRIDAKGLARMGAEQKLSLWQPFSENIYQLRMLTRQNEDLQKQRTATLNRIEAQMNSCYSDEFVCKQLKAVVELLEGQIAEIKTQIEKCIAKDPDIKERTDNLLAIKGLGLVTVAAVIAETNGFVLFSNQKQLVSYAGYDVVENQSGKRAGKTRISKKGNSHIRRAMHLPAFNMVRYAQGNMPAHYLRVYERTGMKMKAYVALQRKLLVIMYSLWKKNEPYDSDYHKISSNDELGALFSQCSEGTEKVPENTGTLDGHPCNESQEALFSHH